MHRLFAICYKECIVAYVDNKQPKLAEQSLCIIVISASGSSGDSCRNSKWICLSFVSQLNAPGTQLMPPAHLRFLSTFWSSFPSSFILASSFRFRNPRFPLVLFPLVLFTIVRLVFLFCIFAASPSLLSHLHPYFFFFLLCLSSSRLSIISTASSRSLVNARANV